MGARGEGRDLYISAGFIIEFNYLFRGRWAYKRQFTIYGHSESTTIACPSTLFLPRLSPHDMDIPGNLTHFHIKEFALSHTQKVRVFGTQKWRHGGHIRDLKQREP